MLVIIFLCSIALVQSEIPYNWLSLATLSTEYSPPLITTGQYDKRYYDDLCNRLIGLNPLQKAACQQHPFSMPFVAKGIREALYECQEQFKYERWNCSELREISLSHGGFQDILGRTLRSTSKESAFLTAVASASIVHAITKGCNSGNMTECGCHTKPAQQRYLETDDPVIGGQDHFSWGGCSDNVPYGVKFAKKFLDEWETAQFEKEKNVSHLVYNHNHFVGREAIAQNVKKQCRCHGVSGSCEFRTCWLQMPKFSEVAIMLKKRYDHFAVQVTKRAKKRLRRKERSERQTPLRGNEMAYVQRSPSYCERNETLGILGTTGRECKQSSYTTESCDHLCCGRGYDTRMEKRKKQCQCKFVWCCEVKCKECVDDVQVHTCK